MLKLLHRVYIFWPTWVHNKDINIQMCTHLFSSILSILPINRFITPWKNLSVCPWDSNAHALLWRWSPVAKMAFTLRGNFAKRLPALRQLSSVAGPSATAGDHGGLYVIWCIATIVLLQVVVASQFQRRSCELRVLDLALLVDASLVEWCLVSCKISLINK